MEKHSKMCTYDINMKATFSVNLLKLQVSHAHVQEYSVFYQIILGSGPQFFAAVLFGSFHPSTVTWERHRGSKSKREQS